MPKPTRRNFFASVGAALAGARVVKAKDDLPALKTRGVGSEVFDYIGQPEMGCSSVAPRCSICGGYIYLGETVVKQCGPTFSESGLEFLNQENEIFCTGGGSDSVPLSPREPANPNGIKGLCRGGDLPGTFSTFAGTC